jgi:type IV pilus assembly protein PilA
MRRGFSLIELLIVIAIILVIITVAIPSYQKAQIFAREMAASKAVQTIQTGEVMYQSEFATSPHRYANMDRLKPDPRAHRPPGSSAAPWPAELQAAIGSPSRAPWTPGR